MIKISKTIANTKRLSQIVSVLSKNGFDNILKKIPFDKNFTAPVFGYINKNNLSENQRIKKTVEELGPTFIKLAQMLSTRPDLIPLELAQELEQLQDNVTPVSIDKIAPIFEEEFGKKMDEIFAKPLVLLATASIGQVYKTQLLNGDDIVVKVLKPKINEIIQNDLEILKKIGSMFDDALLDYGIHSILDVLKEFDKNIKNELNFKLEAINLSRFKNLFEKNRKIKVPKLYKEFSTNKIITMELIDGIKVSDKKLLIQNNINTKKIAKKGFELICEQIFKHRFFHADPHPGNIFITLDSRVAFIDFGMMGSISKEEQSLLLELIYDISIQDEEKIAIDILNMTNYPENIDKNEFVKDMNQVIGSYMYSSLQEINIKDLFHDVTSLISRYGVSFKNDYYLFFKSIATIEGVGRSLDPEFNAIENIKPIIIEFYKEQFSLKNVFGRAKEFPKEIIEFLSYAPNDLKDIFKQVKNGTFKVSLEHKGLQKIEETVEKSFNRLTVALIAASTLIGSSLILHAKTPPLISDVPLFGIAGFCVASVMGLVLAYTIFKSGKL
ncbi:MAG: AarF/ABC1/UbiB kinase family protein [Sulfurospirillum sp.]|nr:AarF/ABC1/UbiB kinase family protein [Sulfurospirillum sp.]MBL0703235.1 AarF/ABC1/UbiB kinase family protein [Sulfurospirillum sp.]